MKNYTRLILVALMLVLTAGAAQAELRFGIKAGLNVNSLHFNKVVEDLTQNDNRCGVTAGVMVEYTVPIIGIGVDLSAMYTRMNSNGDIQTLDVNNVSELHEATIGKNFIEIPLNIKYKFTVPVISRIVKPYLYTGPSFAFKLDKNTLKDIQTKTCQVAWNIGLGLEFVRHLQLQASYGFGVNNIFNTFAPGDFNTVDNVKIKNNYWTITAGWLF